MTRWETVVVFYPPSTRLLPLPLRPPLVHISTVRETQQNNNAVCLIRLGTDLFLCGITGQELQLSGVKLSESLVPLGITGSHLKTSLP